LSRSCQLSLKNAEQQVQQLTEKNGSLQSEPFLSDLPEEC
jgi:exonuclease VII small subunit